jgi:hypothetical protein
MDQLKLLEQEPLPDLEPLDDVGWAVPIIHDPDVVPDAANVGWDQPVQPAPAHQPKPVPMVVEALAPNTPVCHGHSARADHDTWARPPAPDHVGSADVGWATAAIRDGDVVSGSPDPDTAAPTEGLPPSAKSVQSLNVSPADEGPARSSESATDSSPPVHKTHASKPPETPLTDSPASIYDQENRAQKNQTRAYAVATSPPESTVPNPIMPFLAQTQLTPVPCPPEP